MFVVTQGDDYVLLCARLIKNVAPEYKDQLEDLISVRALKGKVNSTGYIGSVSYRGIAEGQEQWAEANLFIGANEDGVLVANILGRDITEIHEAQERRENELKAVAAKDQILSDITKTLCSYNLTLNLESGKYSLIVSTPMNSCSR